MAANPKSKAPTSISEPPSPEGMEIPHERLLAAMVNELARSRVRHRALLDLLVEHGLIKMVDYVERYRLTEERDFKPFVELLLLSPEQFRERWSDWIAANETQYGYDGSSRVSIQLAAGPPRKPATKERSPRAAISKTGSSRSAAKRKR